jgi:aminopeptidase N
MMAVMSATNPTEKSDDGTYYFEMKKPVPAYLIALAVGDIAFKSVGPRTGVYAEPSMLEASVYEFGETEQMLEIAEDLYGTYPWERYDMIILPPSFPFGGMENPRLTFVTPTVVAGDRSLVSLIAHELAHSWSGNLVTNATWNDFWLNEGFTVYFERRIMEELYGDDYNRMLAMLGKQDLENEIEDLGAKSDDTHLYLNLEGRDPDDGMTDIAYEKGALFLKLLEDKVGRKKFDRFLNKYFDENKFQSMTTQRFIPYLKSHLIEPNHVDINIEEWIYGPGLPSNCPVIESDRFEKVDELITRFQGNAAEIAPSTTEWTTHEWIHFIRHLPNDISIQRLAALDNEFNFAQSGNSEIAAAWYEVAIDRGYAPQIMGDIETFLIGVGRRKFLMPLYGGMKDNDMLEKAQNIYSKSRQNYHAVSVQSLDKLLNT